MSEDHEKIQKYIIKSAPFGELNEVLKELGKIAPLDLEPPSPAIAAALEDYSEEHLSLFPISEQEGHFLVMPANKASPGKYFDQLNSRIVKINHLRGKVLGFEEAASNLPEPVQQLLRSLSQKVRGYVSKYFKDPFGSQVFMDVKQEGLVVHVGLTSKNVQLGNFYTGEWISKWVITKDKMEGTVSVKAHFFEAGNVQFQQKKQYSKAFKFTESMDESAKSIVKIIESFESEVQESLNQIYEDMPNGFLKHLRRVIPVHKVKMVWNIHSINMNRNLVRANDSQ